MKKHRWLTSVISAAKTEEIFLPWAMRRAAQGVPMASVPRTTPSAASAPPFATAAR
jgi:hypothetical protein